MTAFCLVALAAVALCGCAPDDPYQQQRPRPDRDATPATSDRSPAAGPADGELPGQVPPELVDEPTRFAEAGSTPQATLARAARLYGNWTSATASGRLRRIAALSVDQAHAELRRAAAQASLDPQQTDVRSSAKVEAIDVDGAGPQRRALVVTRELVRAPDLPAQGWSYRLTVAGVERRADGWVITQWEPQP